MPPWHTGYFTSTISTWSEWSEYLSIIFAGSAPSIQSDESTTTPDDTRPCRYPINEDRSSTLTLADGRKLGYAQFGSPNGKPILYCHGIPGSRLEAAQFDDAAKEFNGRLISVDRPGYGLSTPQPDRSILSAADDLKQLAEHLNLQDYRVIGISGGGPYALACAKALPADKLKSVAVVVGLGPPDIGMKGAGWATWFGFQGGYDYTPAPMIRWFIHRQPIGRLHLSDKQRFDIWWKDIQTLELRTFVEKKDAEFLQEEDRIHVAVRSTRESFRQGFDGMLLDGKLLSNDLGFRVEDIRPDLPLNLWYGKYDTDVPANHGVQIAARFKGEARLHIEEETHASVSSHCKRQFFRELLEH